MRYGKITQTAWRRFVGRQLQERCPEAVAGAAPWQTCSEISLRETEDVRFLWADAQVSGNSAGIGYYAVLEAAGELAARGARARAVSVRILFSAETQEETLRDMTAGIEEACARMNIQVTSLQGDTVPAAAQNIVFVTAAGTVPEGSGPGKKREAEERSGKTGQEIVLCGFAGLEGTLQILDEAEEELKTRFVPAFLNRAKELKRQLVTPEQLLEIFRREAVPAGGIAAVRQIGSGGIFGSLWELAEILRTGFEVNLHAVLLKQETVEICEFYRLNPYQMTSAGSFLIVTEDAENVIGILEKSGARAGRLGTIKAQNARVISGGEEIRYADRPAPDEVVRWMAERSDPDSALRTKRKTWKE